MPASQYLFAYTYKESKTMPWPETLADLAPLRLVGFF